MGVSYKVPKRIPLQPRIVGLHGPLDKCNPQMGKNIVNIIAIKKKNYSNFAYLITSFACQYRQKAGFAGPWELATRTRQQEPASPAGVAYTPANGAANGTT